ncbi:MAG: hypothetical protein GF341_06035 [candidate division Zixibacteria bacterium]|nr:hypothetical protein [candidate division Zixibacteria bacterium]
MTERDQDTKEKLVRSLQGEECIVSKGPTLQRGQITRAVASDWGASFVIDPLPTGGGIPDVERSLMLGGDWEYLQVSPVGVSARRLDWTIVTDHVMVGRMRTLVAENVDLLVLNKALLFVVSIKETAHQQCAERKQRGEEVANCDAAAAAPILESMTDPGLVNIKYTIKRLLDLPPDD